MSLVGSVGKPFGPLRLARRKRLRPTFLNAGVEITAVQVDARCTMGADQPGRASRYEP